MVEKRILRLRISVFQYDVTWMDLRKNLSKIEEVCKNISGNSDILILPEMFTTGYTMTPNLIPNSWEKETFCSLQKFAQLYKLTIGGTIVTSRNGDFFNSFIFVNEKGVIYQYDKIHLFTLAGEKNAYQGGTESKPFELNSIITQSLVCYDLRFPYLSYQHPEKKLLIYSANWPSTRVDHWRCLLQSRAIENQCFVIGVNRTGSDENGYDYPGCSMIVDYNGEIIVEMDKKEGFETCELEFSKLDAYRLKLPFLQDRMNLLP